MNERTDERVSLGLQRLRRETKKLDSCWHGFLRMVKGGFRNKPTEPGNDTNSSLVYTNDDIFRITKCRPLREFIDTQYLK